MRTPWHARERGDDDLRLLPMTAGMWLAALAANAVMRWPTPVAHLHAAGVALAVATVALTAATWTAGAFGRRHATTALRAHGMGMLALCGVLLGMMAGVTHATARMLDPLAAATAQGAAYGTAELRATAPAMRSHSPTADCTVDVTVERTRIRAVERASGTQARMQLTGDACTRIVQGARYRVTGTMRRAAWDETRIVIQTERLDALAEAAPWWRAVERLRARFFTVTARLPDQGRVLVPGVTLGVLGQDVLADTGTAGIDDEYAARLEERCKQAGIMHVMAVSGGHYALIARLCAVCAALARMPRTALAVMQACAYGALTIVLVPGESVTRALYMGLFRIGYLLCGRPGQTMHTLCWTTMIALLLDPDRASDFGFALSCAAVLGIACTMTPLRERLAHWLPQGAAQSLATTLSAQIFTLPVQILIEPSIPLWSVPANLIVAPFMDAATMLGLLACLISAVHTPSAYLCAMGASWCTRPIEIAADLFGAPDGGSLPWATGLPGVTLMIAVLACAAALLAALARLGRIVSLLIHRDGEHGFARTPRPADAVRRWWGQTMAIIATIRWRPRERR